MSDRLIVIGITGLARSGKDTIAGILRQRFGFTRVALADGVRSAFREMDGPTWELTKELEAAGKTSRWALQQLGTEARYATGCHGLWMDVLDTKITYLSKIHPTPRSRFVVPDIRFFAEESHFRFIYGDGFRLWKVKRPGAGLSGEAAAHASEQEVDAIRHDLTIVNSFGIDTLEALVGQHARKLLEAP